MCFENFATNTIRATNRIIIPEKIEIPPIVSNSPPLVRLYLVVTECKLNAERFKIPDIVFSNRLTQAGNCMFTF